MNKEIYIICNSPEALRLISNGSYPNLQKKDLFTCNNAFTFFRTAGKHYNFWTDTRDIMRHVEMPETLSNGYEKHVQHIYSAFGVQMKNKNFLYKIPCSPVQFGCSSALGALAYLNAVRDYDTIYLVGYTLDESANNDVWLPILKKYNRTQGIDYPVAYKFEKNIK